MDDLDVFDSALNAAQVAKLFEMGNPAIDSPQNGPAVEEAAAEEEFFEIVNKVKTLYILLHIIALLVLFKLLIMLIYAIVQINQKN